VSTIAMLFAYGLFFGNVVLLPLWLQQYMAYTATLAGWVLAPVGFLAIVLSPVVGRYVDRIDPRILVSVSFAVFSLVFIMRSHFDTDATIGLLLVPTVIQGATAGALGTSITTTPWDRRATLHHAPLIERMSPGDLCSLRTTSSYVSGMIFIGLIFLGWLARPVHGGGAAASASGAH
jgi:MFS transporter, DHA2 family, multidrug resistance protein